MAAPTRKVGGRKKTVRSPARKTAAQMAKRRNGAVEPALAKRILRAALPAVRRRQGVGMGVVIAVAEGVGNHWDIGCAIADGTAVGGRATRRGGTTAMSQPQPAVAKLGRVSDLARLLSTLGSRHRVKILAKLLEGPATYRAIQKATGLQAGPLYYHVTQLRLAKLIGPKERDLYELTRGGRNLVLVALTLPALVRDARPRPQPAVSSATSAKRTKQA